MQHTFFISDLHLQEEAPSTTEAFYHFMNHQAPTAEALYILGDFFEAWIGDDDETPFHTQLTNSIKRLVDNGIPVYFMHGNRDFLIGQRFVEKSGVTLLPDPTVIELYNQSILLTHGDRLCTLDIKHQSYRKRVNNPWVQKLFLSIPLSARRKLAKRLRKKSQLHNATAPQHITDVTQTEVTQLMEKNHVRLLIHGHTHRPGIHDVTLTNQTGKRIVLGAWHDNASILSFYSDGNYQFSL